MAIALITGTSTGIGFATAVALGRAGHEVYATMRSPHRTPELQTIATREALPITVLPLDVDDDGSVSGAVAHVLAAQGRVDVLVNNAGIGPNGPIEELPTKVSKLTMIKMDQAWKFTRLAPSTLHGWERSSTPDERNASLLAACFIFKHPMPTWNGLPCSPPTGAARLGHASPPPVATCRHGRSVSSVLPPPPRASLVGKA
jgi:NAD(P)-dependent dehydrogenase (short-subunit alcohol dehydrogenase family)